MPAEVIETIFEVIEGGASVEAGSVIQFPTDVVVGETLSGTTTSVTLGNGVATEVSQLTVESATGVTETAGLGLLTMDVGVAGAAAAPILGILAGVGLYNLAPEFWTSVADKLWEAGETVGGKVRAYINPKTKQVGLSETTLEIFKKAFLEAGIYSQIDFGDYTTPYSLTQLPSRIISYDINILNQIKSVVTNTAIYTRNNIVHNMLGGWMKLTINGVIVISYILQVISFVATRLVNGVPYHIIFMAFIMDRELPDVSRDLYDNAGLNISSGGKARTYSYTDGTKTINNIYIFSLAAIQPSTPTVYIEGFVNDGQYVYYPIPFLFNQSNPNLQPDATYPTADKTIPETYPTYTPWELPENLPVPAIYPVEIPVVNPNPLQEEAQNPEPLPDNQPVADWLIDNLPQPNPNPDPPSEGGEVEPPDPPDPNPEPTPGPLPIVPDMPESVNAHKMFTVYNPTDGQLNDFGGWLWTSNIIENIVKIWAGDPIQGILSLRKVYAKPVTGSMKNIVVGYLDSGVDALEVSNQFVTIECGSVQVSEQKHNATDYSPYTSLHLYLPFIGVVELDPNEFMNGSISVTYHIDVYTGSCLAEVKATRAADMPNATILYTFTGNASQELPLSSSNFSGAISSLVSLATAGIAVASGGGLIAAGATASAVHSLTHEMIHINRSGNLSSNAGIMGSRIPYLIIGMRHGYDANAYNELYGYPANKTVYLGNCKGYTRIKAGRLRTKATEAEKKEIMQLCEKGIIL